jgi:short-subunit dehydrogenase
MTQKILIFGATSAIAEAVARRYAADGASLFLIGRSEAKLAAVANDLRARGAIQVETYQMDATETPSIGPMLGKAIDVLKEIDIALIAHGSLPDESRATHDVDYLVREFRINAESTILLLAQIATVMVPHGKGIIAVIGSVAGDRGRASNYLYGAAKSAVHAYASGLRARLWKTGIRVVTIKPGFVATPMTAHLNLLARLTSSPEKVAADVCAAIGGASDVIYTPRYWRVILWIVRVLPEWIFKRLTI